MAQRDSQYWLWVIRPEYYDEVEPATSWSCHKNTKEGDLILMWRAKKKHDIAFLLQATSDPVPDPNWGHVCEYKVLYEFKNPVTIKDLRESDAFFRGWSAYSGNFQRNSFIIQALYWDRLNEIAAEKDPEYNEFLDKKI